MNGDCMGQGLWMRDLSRVSVKVSACPLKQFAISCSCSFCPARHPMWGGLLVIRSSSLLNALCLILGGGTGVELG